MKRKEIDKDILIKLVEEGLSLKEMGKYFGCCYYIVSDRIREYGIKYISKCGGKGIPRYDLRRRPDIDKQWFIDNWLNTEKSLITLSKEENLPHSLLQNRANRFGLTKKRKYKINEKKLFNINDPCVWYVAGLIATDGYFRNNSDVIEVCLVGEDELDLLTRIKEYFESDCPIRRYGNKSAVVLSYKGIQSFFSTRFNIPIKDKTHFLKTPDMFPSEDCVKTYLLGCIDGDGNVSYKRKRIRIATASEDFIDGLVGIINKYSGTIATKYFMKTRGKKYPGVMIRGKGRCDIFDRWLLSYDHKLFLRRKKEELVKMIIGDKEEVM